MVTDIYIEKYQMWTDWAQDLWKDKERPEYEADIWFNKQLNRIARDMIGDVAVGRKVLGIGAAMWVDAALLMGLKAKEYIRTDIIKTPGIDVVCDACELPFPDKSFDVVVCREVIEHVADDEALLSEAHRVLVDEGWLYITTPNMLDNLPDGKFHVRGYTPLGFLYRLKLSGFRVIKKRGSVPNVHYSLMTIARKGMAANILPEFQSISNIFDRVEDSYYLGGNLMALARRMEW